MENLMSNESEVKSPKTLRHIKLVASVAALALAGVVALGISSRVHAKQKLTSWTNEQAIPTVVTVSPTPIGSSQPLVLPGTLAAEVNAPIYARVPGYLHAWYADIGTHVKAGQLLGEIDTPDLDQQLQQARGDLQNSIANQKLAAVTAQQAIVDANQANVRRLEALESFKKLVAPFDGIVTARNTDVGQLINVGSGSNQALFTVSDAHKLRVYVSAPQVDAAAIQSGLAATITVPERPGMTFKAKMVDTSNAITPSSGTLLVQLTVDNSAGLLFPGEYTAVHLALPGDTNTVTIPASSLIFRQDGLQVAVVGKDDRAQLRSVTISTDLGSTVQISSGLRPDDKVINNPPDSLVQGDLVRLATIPRAPESSHG
jgi:multidrug efflux system membrane fusion protein